MPVEAVNNNNNKTLIYTASATGIGAAAGATYGYFSKPYLKGAIASDSFCDALFSTAKKAKPEIFSTIDTAWNGLKSIKNPEELKLGILTLANMGFDNAIANLEKSKLSFAEAKQMILDQLSSMTNNNKEIAPILEKLEKVGSINELIEKFTSYVNKNITQEHVEKLNQFTKELENNFKQIKKVIGSSILWASSMNALQDDKGKSLPIDKLIKAAKAKVQLKAAGIYGAGAAVVAGLGTLIYQSSKNSSTKQA